MIKCLYSERYSNLLALEEAAKAQKRGVWSTDDANEHKRHITWNIDNPAEYSQQNKDKHIKGIVVNADLSASRHLHE